VIGRVSLRLCVRETDSVAGERVVVVETETAVDDGEAVSVIGTTEVVAVV
jgi:hypothetical protein